MNEWKNILGKNTNIVRPYHEKQITIWKPKNKKNLKFYVMSSWFLFFK
jgi:hypothetical protein